MPRIALVHATTIAMEPIRDTLARDWPEAEAMNILDDSLSPDRASAGEVNPALTRRMIALARYAVESGAEGALFTCSAFGPAIEAAAREIGVPILKPNEAMFEAAIRKGGRTAMLYTFDAAGPGMEEEFRDEAARLNPSATITSFLVDGAIEAVRAGDVERHNALVAEKAASLRGFDAITLAHFSTARALDAVRARTDIPVITSPDAAVAKLRRLVERTPLPA